jgi:hypothetical protein
LSGFDVTTRLRTSSGLTARRRACAVPSSLTTTALWRSSKDFSRLNDVVAGASRMLFNLVSPPKSTGGRTTTAVRIEARPGGVPRAGIAEFDVSDTLSFLHEHGINPEGWGKSGAKSVGDLTREVNEGESVLRDGKRMIFVVKVIIRDGDYELVEARQVCMRNGSVRYPSHFGLLLLFPLRASAFAFAKPGHSTHTHMSLPLVTLPSAMRSLSLPSPSSFLLVPLPLFLGTEQTC